MEFASASPNMWERLIALQGLPIQMALPSTHPIVSVSLFVDPVLCRQACLVLKMCHVAYPCQGCNANKSVTAPIVFTDLIAAALGVRLSGKPQQSSVAQMTSLLGRPGVRSWQYDHDCSEDKRDPSFSNGPSGAVQEPRASRRYPHCNLSVVSALMQP